MQESSIQETPTAAQVAQESRSLRPRGGDASRVTPGAQLNMESTTSCTKFAFGHTFWTRGSFRSGSSCWRFVVYCSTRSINSATCCSLIPYYMYMYITYIYIYMLYGIQDPRWHKGWYYDPTAAQATMWITTVTSLFTEIMPKIQILVMLRGNH